MKIELEGKIYDLDIDQAKKLNLLKEEDTRCKSWEDFKKVHKNADGYICYTNGECSSCIDILATDQQFTKADAKALWALSRLMKLRRNWVGNWETQHSKGSGYYAIMYSAERVVINEFTVANSFLTFPTERMAKEFLKCFKDLIELAKNYI